MKRLKYATIASLTSFLLSGCATSSDKITNISASSVNETVITKDVSCIAKQLDFYRLKKDDRVKVAVGSITDKTGKFDQQNGGYQVTQGATEMVYNALFNSGAYRVLERADLGVHSFELDYSNKQLLRNEQSYKNGSFDRNLRFVQKGDVVGSDYYVTGAITEVNYNFSSGGYVANISGIELGKRTFSMTVAIDLRFVDTVSLEVLNTVSIRKEMTGYETKQGLYRFEKGELFDLSAGNKVQEPLQLGIRQTIEKGVFDLTSELYGFNKKGYGSFCDSLLPRYVFFDFNEWQKMHYEYYSLLRKYVEFLKLNPEKNLLLNGHADERGTDGYNLDLAEKRAKTIKEFFAYEGINPARISIQSFGESQPLFLLKEENAHRYNRRVEILIR